MSTIGRLLGRARALSVASTAAGRSLAAPTAKQALDSAIADLTPESLGISPSVQEGVNSRGRIGSLEVYSDPSVALEVFLLPRGAALPLHDHPRMTVLSKILWGGATVHQLDWADERNMVANIAAPVHAEPGDVMELQPHWANLHQIEACPERGLAFVDLFMPPYDHRERCCTYFRPRGSRAKTLPALSEGQGVALERFSPRSLSFTHYSYSGPDPTPVGDDATPLGGAESST